MGSLNVIVTEELKIFRQPKLTNEIIAVSYSIKLLQFSHFVFLIFIFTDRISILPYLIKG